MLTRFKSFLEERIGLSALTRALAPPLLGGPRWARTLGWSMVWLLALELCTGLALMTVYAPSVQTAWASTAFLQHLAWGAAVRGLHHWAAQALLVTCGLHLVHVLLAGAYRRPREVNWWAGLLLLGLVFGAAHSGALLPWDQQAYWTSVVEAGIAGSVPVVGATSARLLAGGRELGSLSITRMYALHVGLLPLATLALVAGHVALTRRHGSTPPASLGELGIPSRTTDAELDALRARGVRVERAWPSQAARDALVAALVVALVAYLARRYGAPLDAPADPDGEYPARPEWYLLWLYRLRKYFEGPREIIATVVLPGLGTTLLALVPLLDRAPSRALRGRRLGVVAMALAILGAVPALTLVALRADARDPGYQRARALADRRAARALELAAAGVPPDGPLEMVRNDPRVRPGELWAEHCSGCHAEASAPARDAAGHHTNARGPSLEGFGSRGWARAMMINPDADALFNRTEIHGMPSQLRRVGDDGVAAIAEYLYGQSVEAGDAPADTTLAARGSELYHRRCTVCHQGAGDLSETPVEERDAPELTGWGSRGYIREQIVRPEARYGHDNAMPSFGDRLSARELEWVIDAVRGMRARPPPVVTAPPPPPTD